MKLFSIGQKTLIKLSFHNFNPINMIFLTLDFGLPQKKFEVYIMLYSADTIFSENDYPPIEEIKSTENKMFNFDNHKKKIHTQKCLSFENNL